MENFTTSGFMMVSEDIDFNENQITEPIMTDIDSYNFFPDGAF